eukprot:4747906-Amphidinium_carterae.1
MSDILEETSDFRAVEHVGPKNLRLALAQAGGIPNTRFVLWNFMLSLVGYTSSKPEMFHTLSLPVQCEANQDIRDQQNE